VQQRVIVGTGGGGTLSLRPVRTFPVGWVFDARFTRDGTLLATVTSSDPRGYGDCVKVWDVATGGLRLELPAPVWDFNVSHPVAFSPDGDVLAVGTEEGVWLWRLFDGEKVTSLTVKEVRAVALDAKGELIATTGHRTRLWRASGELVWESPVDGDSIAIDGARSRILVANYEAIRGLTLRDAGEAFARRGPWGDVDALELRADAAVFATGSCGDVACLWSAEHGELLSELPHDDDVTALAFWDDRRLITHDGTLRIWDWATRTVASSTKVGCAALARFAGHVAVVDHPGTVHCFAPQG
jgi:WD40 repeat protein